MVIAQGIGECGVLLFFVFKDVRDPRLNDDENVQKEGNRVYKQESTDSICSSRTCILDISEALTLCHLGSLSCYLHSLHPSHPHLLFISDILQTHPLLREIVLVLTRWKPRPMPPSPQYLHDSIPALTGSQLRHPPHNLGPT